jgi:polyhydroxyalkanoate synthesis regulator phasin
MNKKDGIGLLLEESISKGGQRRISSIDSRYTSAKKSPMRQLLRNQDLNQLEQQVEHLKIKLKEEKLKT